MPRESHPVSFLLRSGQAERVAQISHTPYTLGRAPDSDLVLAEPCVSRLHAAIISEAGGYYVSDQGSRHGTYVNGKRVTHQRLLEGDTIHLGDLDGPAIFFGVGDQPVHSAGPRPSETLELREMMEQFPAVQASGSGLEKLRWFFETARKLNSYGAVDQILAVLLETTLELTHVERGYVFLRDVGGELVYTLGRNGRGEPLADDSTLSRSAIEKARRTVSEYIVTDTLNENAIARTESVIAHNIRTIICIPLRKHRRQSSAAESELLGLLYLDSRLVPGSLTDIDGDLLRTISTEAAALVDNAQLALAEERERRYREELDIAAGIQQGLMAVQIPSLTWAAVTARSVACKEVGGDFFDVVADGQSLSIVIADISGKGISAAILASTLQGLIYAQLLAGQPLDQIAEVANRYICTRRLTKYATMVILRIGLDGTVEYINCGHLRPLLLTGNTVVYLEQSNVPVGLLGNASFTASQVWIKPGARLLLVSDGVTEAEDAAGEFFGDERLHALFAQGNTLDQMYEQVRSFCGATPLNDDRTLVEVVYRG